LNFIDSIEQTKKSCAVIRAQAGDKQCISGRVSQIKQTDRTDSFDGN
jgi:hypothetical protein